MRLDDDDDRIMDINHPDWKSFLARLNSKIKYQGCSHRRFVISAGVLIDMGLSNYAIRVFIKRFGSNGCVCDCDLLRHYWY
jgi:hypothetical protein